MFQNYSFRIEYQWERIGTGGFEPPTPRTPSVCATWLRHVPNLRLDIITEVADI
jgi:hypothetical protein